MLFALEESSFEIWTTKRRTFRTKRGRASKGHLLISGIIGCALSLKFCRRAWAQVFQRTQKVFWEIPLVSDFIKIIIFSNGVPKSKLRKIKILMGINLIRGET